ncbi:LmbE family N-acetylglucosaminyl deacetylase [Spinactinospora alkalitolerans]|uniref:LmbE family N-acetylglucosaminyl deacetylase n=1 Tax=Spinactinospora alkalitolerans TaxID=687207 RepID=A0A852TY73_9ACTN|nr:PIG-L family deacetylase [Spinactinospora alkalitolerans]NYE48949.1 LmbE family N-acetylglucosaminyl deacetylase [Spinactinospora alkalitolerans]
MSTTRWTRWSSGHAHSVDDAGTSETVWRGWPALHEFPALHVADTRSAVVVAPHPDDEVLGFGGAISMLAATDALLRIVAVTDGAAPDPGGGAPVRTEQVERRIAETERALEELGAGDAEIVRLELPDGRVAGAEAELELHLVELCTGFEVCAAPWEGDMHPDHDATGRAARTAADAVGASLLEYPIWMWHWALPDDGRVPWADAHRIVLPEEVRAAKAAAIACFTSQTRPLSGHAAEAAILPPEMVAHFTRDAEVVFT